jgi:hypothetical protein
MSKERVLITVKTYPTLSKTYAELVCTAGFREDGSWIRIYPLPFRFLDENQKYKKYQWIELALEKNPSDPRPESYRPRDRDNIEVLGSVDTKNAWEERRRLILSRNVIHSNLKTIIDAAHENQGSLAIFKPKEIVDLVVEPTSPDWELSKREAAEAVLRQGSLFDDGRSDFTLVRKLPYKFKYKFLDDAGKSSSLMIEDWEIAQLYWNCLKNSTPEEAVKKVRAKYLDDFACQKDLYLFLGTTLQWHVRKAPNPYVIIGTFHPPFVEQLSLWS